MFTRATVEDSFAAKGLLIAALRLPDDGIVIAACTHMDSGNDEEIKLWQLDQAVGWIQSFNQMIDRRQTGEIIATVFSGDFNIDGVGFWQKSTLYARTVDVMSIAGFQDSWHINEVVMEDIDQELIPERYPGLGITAHHYGCAKRLDYIWISPGNGFSVSSALVTLNEQEQWQTPMGIQAAIKSAKNPELQRRLIEEADFLDRQDRLSDHAAMFGTFTFIIE